MERKRFLATAFGVGAALAAASAALAAPNPTNTMTPANHQWNRGEYRSNRNIRIVRKHLERVIDELQHDQHDYAGHRERALDFLNRAREELLLAEQASTSTSNRKPVAAPTAYP